jgi:hypothetical protein
MADLTVVAPGLSITIVQGGGVVVPGHNLIGKQNLVYQGAFRLPQVAPSGQAGYNAGATGLGYNPLNHSLILRVDEGLNQYNEYLGEVSIPTPTIAATVADLPVATSLNLPTNLFNGTLNAGLNGSGRRVRGILVDPDGTMVLAAYVNYDGNYEGARSHFVRTTDFANPAISGPFEINTFGAGSALNGGCAGGWQCNIPQAWRAALGGDTLASNWDISINGRASWGPCAIVFNRLDLGVTTPAPGIPLLFYYAAHPTLGTPGQENAIWNDTGLNDACSGAVFVEGTDTILFINTHTNHASYGIATTDPALDGQPDGEGGVYCYDVETTGKGNHGNPWTQQVLAYDVNDLVAVKNGTKAFWEPVPYAVWDFTFPQFQNLHFIVGTAYDPATQRIFMASEYGDPIGGFYNAPLIHVFQVTV